MIHTVKLVCPQQHQITSSLYDRRRCDAGHAFDLFSGTVQMLVSNGALQWECPLCGSRELHYEDAPTHATLHEALLSLPAGRRRPILLGTGRRH